MMQDYSMNYHYLFNLQSKLAIGAFGQQNWAIRLPAVVFGLGAIAAKGWLARDIAGACISR
jgi:mannosyltransferase